MRKSVLVMLSTVMVVGCGGAVDEIGTGLEDIELALSYETDIKEVVSEYREGYLSIKENHLGEIRSKFSDIILSMKGNKEELLYGKSELEDTYNSNCVSDKDKATEQCNKIMEEVVSISNKVGDIDVGISNNEGEMRAVLANAEAKLFADYKNKLLRLAEKSGTDISSYL